MLTQPTLQKLQTLKFTGMLKGFKEQIESDQFDSLSFEERLGLLVDLEITEREDRRLNTRLRQAKLRVQACMEDIKYSSKRGLDKSLIKSFYSCKWIKDGNNILITGATGAGKSYLACALAHRACIAGYKTRYFRASRLFEELLVAKGDGRYPKLMTLISRQHLIVIDDWGLCKLSDNERSDLLEILEDRYQINSTIIASQLPIDHWHETIANPTFADAIMDRIIHNAYKINLKGESMRKTKIKSL
jgi:DNA replication protein DnaC